MNIDGDYWEKRINTVFDDSVSKKEIATMYRKQYEQIEADILELYDKAVNEGITTRSDLYKLQHCQDLMKSIEAQNRDIKSSLRQETLDTLTQAYKATYSEVVDMLGKSSAWSVQNDHFLKSVLTTKWEGNSFSNRIWKNTNNLSQRIKADVTTAIVSGTNKDTLIKAIKRDYNVGFAEADRLVRTETMHTINQAQLDTYKSEGIKKVEWHTGGGERTCEVCGAMHGKVFDVEKAPTLMHPRCRCTVIAVIPDDWLSDDYSDIPDSWLDEEEIKRKYGGKSVDKSGKSGIIEAEGVKNVKSGAFYGALNPETEKDFKRCEAHALSYYEEIRTRSSDIKAIAENVDYDIEKIETIKKHIFINKYDLGEDEPTNFYPNYDIAVSWQNLIDGKNIEEKDIILLKHEYYEYCLMKNKGMTYVEAHKKAQEKYNYKRAVEDWRKNEK